jgi:hypothetical protein
MGRIDQFADALRDGIGFTDISPPDEPPLPPAAPAITLTPTTNPATAKRSATPPRPHPGMRCATPGFESATASRYLSVCLVTLPLQSALPNFV